MKKKVVGGFLLTLVITLGIFSLSKQVGKPTVDKEDEVLGQSNPSITKLEISFENKMYRVVARKVDASQRLDLRPNLSTQETANNLFTTNSCSLLTNAGFYSPGNVPIGLFISEDETISPWQQNSLLNAVFSVNDFETPRITRQPPRDHLRLAVQSGPLLIENGQILKGAFKEGGARRVIVATTGANETYFLAIYDPESYFLGPDLNDLPEFLSEIEERLDVEFADAINLDGGSASAFITKDFALTELSTIGGYFCVSE